MIAPGAPRGRFWIGLDVGSTAVKAAVLEAGSTDPLMTRYLRHGTRQAAGAITLLKNIEREHPGLLTAAQVVFTGSGGRTLAGICGCRYAQEVNAVALATERLHPQAGSVIDIGGQDAKMIIWTAAGELGRRKLFSMNDKCAGGTGSVIDRIASKLGLDEDELRAIATNQPARHSVAARCGVFAETDINSLQKQGVAREELIAALFEAIVQQNLSVLTRGATLKPPVLLLGGPHAFLPGLVATWRRALAALWDERECSGGAAAGERVQVPTRACYFPALGAVFYGLADDGRSSGPVATEVRRLLERALSRRVSAGGLPGLIESPAEREALRRMARQEPPAGFPRRKGACDVVLGLDAGSTSTKAVLLAPDGTLLAKAYRLSGGDPLADARLLMGDLAAQAHRGGLELRVRGFGITGYAKDMLGELLGADLILVETVAHTRSALAIDPAIDVIVDVGGQDIKVLILRDGRVRDFRLNSQCSAGNGYFLQSTAKRFGIPLEQFAEEAFRAARAARFNVGCAVFLEADIVNFQQIGWQPAEILAGLVRVLPRNIWLHVVGEPNLERLGSSYLLQGGTQRNEAAVKAQADYIRARVPRARVAVHPHAGESGAIGVALDVIARGLQKTSRFIGLAALQAMEVNARQDESTRCHRCPNQCARTVLTAKVPGREPRHFVVASCETGRRLEEKAAAPEERRSPERPDFSALAATSAFAARPLAPEGGSGGRRSLRLPISPARRRARLRRRDVRIGIPRALNLFQMAPFFRAYLQALGLGEDQMVISGATTEALFRRGVRRGAIDNCYPSKLALAHVHDLLYRRQVDWIFMPVIVNLPQEFSHAVAATICPSAQATPAVIKAAFTREGDRFAERGCRYFDPVFHMGEPALLEREVARFWGPLLGVGRDENRRAIARAWASLRGRLEDELRRPALAEIRRLEREGRVGIVVMGRPYHDDPGLNHRIFRDLNRLGYPIFSISALPRDSRFLGPLFREEIALGHMTDEMDLSDVWRHSFSANSNAKIWAAKVVARHPNLVALDVSSFRCGHDAPIYATVEAILEAARTPYFTFHEIDENRPAGAIRLRVETIDYFLKEYQARGLRQRAFVRPVARETMPVHAAMRIERR